MDFTIVIKKVEYDKEIKDISDLELFHGECYDGRIEATEISKGRLFKDTSKGWPHLAFVCTKCKTRVWVSPSDDPYVKIFKTAVDGKKRRMSSSKSEEGWCDGVHADYDSNEMFNYRRVYVYVSQKGVNELFCPYCGGQLMPEGSYCPFCGINVEDRVKELKETPV